MGRLGNVLKFGDFSSGAVIQLFTMNSLRNPNSPVALHNRASSLTTPATTSAAYTPPATDSHEIVDPHLAACSCLCDATGRRGRADPVRDPPGISAPLRRTHDRNLPEIAYRSRIAEQQLAVAAVSASVMTRQRFSQEWIATAQTSCVIVAVAFNGTTRQHALLSSTPGQYPDNTASVFPAHVLPVFGRWSAYRRIPTAAVLCRFHHGYQGCNHG